MNDDNESDRAEVGSGSRSIGITFSPAVEMAFERALAAAKKRAAASLSTEDVLIELLEEETTSEFLASSRIDVDALRAELTQHQAKRPDESPDGTQPRSDEPLQNAMRRAVIKALASNEKGASGADIVVAILVENESFAADVLRRFGLTAASAEAAAVERYLQRSKEQARLVADVQEKAREQRQLTAKNIDKAQGVRLASLKQADGSLRRDEDSGNRAYVLRITSDGAEAERVIFKAALSRNGILDLYVEETPLEIEFVAGTIVALVEAVQGGERLDVQLITDLDGGRRVISAFRGSAGAIFRDRASSFGKKSGVLE